MFEYDRSEDLDVRVTHRRSEDAKGGFLREIGDAGIIVIKDFGSIFSMHGEKRQTLLAAFREIYDGQWVRRLGTDGRVRR